ncbi:MAG: hypothetical protein GXP55_16710 [Deltaproteobacteria bacterium]|nr:hypothetical protein [Deltaproteobacteria bacterium]
MNCGTDCDDSTLARRPGQLEICDSIDNDCDGMVDEEMNDVPWYTDGDSDGFGAAGSVPMNSCIPIVGRSLLANDCDDTTPSISVVAAETCDGVDNNCNGIIDEGCGVDGGMDGGADGGVDGGVDGGTCDASGTEGTAANCSNGCDDDGDGFADCDDSDCASVGVCSSSQPALQTGTVSPVDRNTIDPATAMAADFSCLSTNTAPAGGGPVAFNLVIKELNDGNTFEGLHVKFWANNTPDNTIWNAATDHVTDVDGMIAVTAPAGGWYAYRVFPQDGPTPSLEIVNSLQTSEPAPTAPSSIDGISVSRDTLNLIPTVFGFRQATGTALLVGRMEDCVGANVYGARVQVVRADGTVIAEGTTGPEPHYRYFDGTHFPLAGQEWSHVDGRFEAANLPVTGDEEQVLVRMVGRTTAGGSVASLCPSIRTPRQS